MSVLLPAVAVVVHSIDVEAHPTVPPGFRWAVQVGGTPPSDMNYCANAGWAPDKRTALLEGETCGATAVRALRMLGVPAEYAIVELDHDPVPAGADRVNFVG